MFHRYDYEAEFYPALSRLPLDLRRKLDLTGIKISLKHWLAYGLEERAVLCHLPCDSDDEKEVFRRYLDFLSGKYLGQPAKKSAIMSEALWSDSTVPEAVVERCQSLRESITLEEWRGWRSPHRFALYKTAVSKSQPEAFEQVLRQLRKLLS
jgi:hypothetical protein